MIILGIETSCDETAAAVVELSALSLKLSVLSNVVASQINIHKAYGGVVPEVAARTHVTTILPTIAEAIHRARAGTMTQPKIDAIAVTYGPGLMTSLAVGVNTATALGYVWGVPVVGINHLAGHIAANFLSTTTYNLEPRTHNLFPALALLVSGGHTELVFMPKLGKYRLLGQTRDDAAGEAFDKIGKMLKLPYPAGPHLAKLAERGNPKNFPLPRPMMEKGNFSAKGGPAYGWDFSFAGLKTAVRYGIQKKKVRREDVAASTESAIVDVLVAKTIRAAKQYKVKTVFLAGGVAANKKLRKKLCEAVQNLSPITYYLSPPLQYCTDNAAMVAAAGALRISGKKIIRGERSRPDPNLTLTSFDPYPL